MNKKSLPIVTEAKDTSLLNYMIKQSPCLMSLICGLGLAGCTAYEGLKLLIDTIKYYETMSIETCSGISFVAYCCIMILLLVNERVYSPLPPSHNVIRKMLTTSLSMGVISSSIGIIIPLIGAPLYYFPYFCLRVVTLVCLLFSCIGYCSKLLFLSNEELCVEFIDDEDYECDDCEEDDD